MTLAASLLSAQTQQTGQTGTGSSTAGTTNTGSTGANPNNPGTPINNTGNATTDKGNRGQINSAPENPQLPSAGRQQIIMITGSVVLDDGTPPPSGAIIERECGGRKTRETNVSPNGNFGFQVGGDTTLGNLIPDASESGFTSPWESSQPASIRGFPKAMPNPAMSIMGCELRAQLGGYRSSTIMLTASQSMGMIDVGTIVLYSAERVRGTTISVASLAAPKDAQKALGRAEKALQKKKLGEAENHLLAALQVYPVYAAAWFRLGQVYVQSDRMEAAQNAYIKAMETDTNYVSPYIELARLAAMQAKWAETAQLTDRGLELDPVDFPFGYYMNAVAHYNLGHFDAAEASGRKLNQLDPFHRWPQIHLILASILHRKRDFGGETDQLRAYLKYAPGSADAGEVRSRLSALEKEGRD